jgi:hypothetical protein
LIVIGNLPFCQSPRRNETLRRVRSGAEKGNLRARPGKSRAAGIVPSVRLDLKILLESTVGASGTDRCYEPALEPDLLSRFTKVAAMIAMPREVLITTS